MRDAHDPQPLVLLDSPCQRLPTHKFFIYLLVCEGTEVVREGPLDGLLYPLLEALDSMGEHWTVLDRIAKYWIVLGSIPQYLSILNSVGQYWTAVDSIDKYWAVSGSIG